MTDALVVPLWVAVAGGLLLAGSLVVTAWLAAAQRRNRASREEILARTAGEVDALREQLDAVQERLRAEAEELSEARRRLEFAGVTIVDDARYEITALGQHRAGPLGLVPAVPASQVVDLVLRESLVRTAAIAAGLRRALAPEVRNRVRFEMRREVRRSRKQRKVNLKVARREWEARERAAIPVSDGAR